MQAGQRATCRLASAGPLSNTGPWPKSLPRNVADEPRDAARQACQTRRPLGFEDENALFASAISDSVCPAICCNPDNPSCDNTAEMEPDQDRGWCEMCERGTLVSGLVLGGII